LKTPGNTDPILFVDVDGVISLFGFNATRPPEGRFHAINGMPHYISLTCGMRLRRLREHFELVWATGWEETANEYLPHLLGLPGSLPWLTFNGSARFGTAHWKLEAIATYARGRPLAWIDDSLDGECSAWARQRTAPTLLVPTRADEGMRDDHVDRLIAWANRLKVRPAA
jgi:HAD domain in Swiss Army Knife RNA repair proteins